MAGSPVWSPDGRWIAYDGAAEGKQGLAIVHPDGSGATFLSEAHGTKHAATGYRRGGDVVAGQQADRVYFRDPRARNCGRDRRSGRDHSVPL